MLFWTPILEYIKIRPFAISKLSPDERVGGGTGKIWAESGVEGAGSGGRGARSGGRGGREIDFFNGKFREKGSFRPISSIKVHQGKHAYLCGQFCHTTNIMYGASRISA